MLDCLLTTDDSATIPNSTTDTVTTDSRAERLQQLRATFDNSTPAGIVNAPNTVNSGLEFAPAWRAQNGLDLPTPTVIDNNFYTKLYKHFNVHDVDTTPSAPNSRSDSSDTETSHDDDALRLTDAQRSRTRSLIAKFGHLFASSDTSLQPVTSVTCDIVTDPSQKPIAVAPYPLSAENREFIREQILSLFALDP